MAYATMEGSVTRTYKERCAEAASGFLDGIDKIDRIAETDTPNASNPVNPVKDPPRLPASNNSALSDSNLTLSSVTNPCFYGIEKGTDTVTLGVAWPDAHSLPNGRLDVFGHWQLTSGGWTRLAQVDVSGAQPPAAVEIDVGSFPTDAMERAAFFRLATQDDSDGDGLSDAYEAWTLGTGPANPDTDGDGLPDGAELSLGTDPLGADTDGDGICDGDETGYIVKADDFEWHDTTGWATVYGTSYGDGLHSYWGALAVASLPDGLTVLGSLMSKAVCFDNGVMYLNAPGSNVALVFPELATPLDRGTYSMGDILVAPYWCSAARPDDVPTAEKERRDQVLLADQEVRGQRRNDALVGTVREVMVEGPSKRNKARLSGRDSGNRIVVWEPPADAACALRAPAIGSLVRIRITEAHPQILVGVPA